MKKILLVCLVCVLFTDWYNPEIRLTILTWNIENFGKSKTRIQLNKIAEIIKEADIVAIQEVVNSTGTEKIEELVEILNESGIDWECSVSNVTNSPSDVSEKYAFLWKESKVQIVDHGRLLREMDAEIDREPYYATFSNGKESFTVLSIHTRPQDTIERTREEIESLAKIPGLIVDRPTFILGDFNMIQRDISFNGIKSFGYKAILNEQKTSLRKSCIEGDYLSESYDNIFHSKDILIHNVEVKDYVQNCYCYDFVKSVSDHLPVKATFSLE